GPKDIRFTVFKVLKPSSKGPAQILTNRTQAPPICSPGLVTNRVFEFIHAFLARPFHSPLKMVAQKVEPSGSTGVYQPRSGASGAARPQTRSRPAKPCEAGRAGVHLPLEAGYTGPDHWTC